MRTRMVAVTTTALVAILAVAVTSVPAQRQQAEPNHPTRVIEIVREGSQYSTARLEPARLADQYGIAVIFEGTEQLHYYAKAETAPAAGLELKVTAESELFEFGQAIFPNWHIFVDSIGTKVEVYSGDFTVFVPIKAVRDNATRQGPLTVRITGIACTETRCLPPFEKKLTTTVDWARRETWRRIQLVHNGGQKGPALHAPSYSAWIALPLAFLAGIVLNIMPCVLPVIPLKVLSIFEQAKESKARCVGLGLAFCGGILLFFAALAGANIVLRLGYGRVFQWGDHFRNPAFLIGMSLLLVVLALFMLGVFTITVPASIASKAGARKGFAGSVAMGFLAAILSTPCSFAILTAAFAWAQTQHLLLSTVAIMAIGLGMAAPYAILTSMPGLLKYLPKPGRWTELFKQAMGFVLLAVAIWLVLALPQQRQGPVLYYAVILAFCVWMWGGWVNMMTPVVRRRVIRAAALVLAVGAGWWLLPAPAPAQINWQDYDRDLIEQAVAADRPVLVEFMADWCMTCKAVEKLVYSRRDVASLIRDKGVLAVKANTTSPDNPATLDLKQRYGEPGVPVTLLFVPERTEPLRFHGLWIAKQLRQALQRLPDRQP